MRGAAGDGVSEGVSVHVRAGERDGFGRVFSRAYALAVGRGAIIHGGHGDADRGRGGHQHAVRDAEGEAVRPVVVRRRRVEEVRARRRERAVQRAAENLHRQGIAVRVCAGGSNQFHRVLGGGDGLRRRHRRVVHVRDGERNRGRVADAVAVRDAVGKAVRAKVIRGGEIQQIRPGHSGEAVGRLGDDLHSESPALHVGELGGDGRGNILRRGRGNVRRHREIVHCRHVEAHRRGRAVEFAVADFEGEGIPAVVVCRRQVAIGVRPGGSERAVRRTTDERVSERVERVVWLDARQRDVQRRVFRGGDGLRRGERPGLGREPVLIIVRADLDGVALCVRGGDAEIIHRGRRDVAQGEALEGKEVRVLQEDPIAAIGAILEDAFRAADDGTDELHAAGQGMNRPVGLVKREQARAVREREHRGRGRAFRRAVPGADLIPVGVLMLRRRVVEIRRRNSAGQQGERRVRPVRAIDAVRSRARHGVPPQAHHVIRKSPAAQARDGGQITHGRDLDVDGSGWPARPALIIQRIELKLVRPVKIGRRMIDEVRARLFHPPMCRITEPADAEREHRRAVDVRGGRRDHDRRVFERAHVLIQRDRWIVHGQYFQGQGDRIAGRAVGFAHRNGETVQAGEICGRAVEELGSL